MVRAAIVAMRSPLACTHLLCLPPSAPVEIYRITWPWPAVAIRHFELRAGATNKLPDRQTAQ